MRRIAFRVGTVRALVCAADATSRQFNQKQSEVPSAPVDRSFTVRPQLVVALQLGSTAGGAGIRLFEIFRELGLTRHPNKRCLLGSQELEHLGVLIDTRQMRVFVTDRKIRTVRKMAQEIMMGRNATGCWFR
jgi:hypothetical protein